MGERLSGRIKIGGPVKKSLISGLIEAINEQEVSIEYGDAPVKIKDEEELLECISEFGYLEFCDEQANWGEFDGLEDFLAQNGIPYNRFSEGSGEYHPETSYYRSDMIGPDTFATDHNGNKLIYKDEIQKVLELMSQSFFSEATKCLKEMIVGIPELPRFEIVEE